METSWRGAQKYVGHFMIVALCLAWTIGAWLVFPVWDDGWLFLQIADGGPESVLRNLQDRPLLGLAWSWLAERNALWTVSAVTHFCSWLVLALSAARLWTVFFPEGKSFSYLAGLLAVSPVFADFQLVMTNPVWGAVLPAALIWGSFGVTLSLEVRRVWLIALIAFPASLLAGAISEYGVAAALACSAAGVEFWRRRRSWHSLVPSFVFALGGACGYLVLRLIHEASVRPRVQPERILDDLAKHFFWGPLTLLSTLYRAVAGEFLEAIGRIPTIDGGTSLVVVVVGAAMGWVAYKMTCPQSYHEVEEYAGGASRWGFDGRHGVLLLTVATGVAPFCLMLQSIPNGSWDPRSRFWTAVLPAVACTSLALLFRISKRRIDRRVMAGIVVAVVFANSALLAGDAYRVERKLRNGSRALRDSVASAGETVVVLAEQDWSNFARWYDLEVQLFGEHPASRGGRVTVGPTLGAVGLLSGALSCTGKLELTSPDERRLGGKLREPEPVARLVLGSVMNFGEDSRTVVLDMVSETESGAAKSDPIFKN